MRLTRRHDEHGAVAVFTAVVMAVMVLMAAIGVDLGMQRVVRRDMQALADAVAFDMSRQADGRTAASILASSSWTNARTQTIARNAATTLGSTPTVTLELGTVDASYTFTPVSGPTVPTAVRVTATSSIDFAFISGSGSATRNAVAVVRAQACYELGSWGARLNTAANANVIYRVLAAHGIGASVGAATYQSLFGAHVDVTDLSTALGIASPEALGTTEVTLSTLLDAVATVVGTNGSSSTQISALDTIKANVGSLGGNKFWLSGLFSVATGAGSGLTAAVNLADLVVGSILLVNGNSAVSVPGLTASVPNFAPVSNTLTLVQAAKTACGFVGSTPNTSNQVTLTSTGTLSSNLSVATSLVSTVTGLLGISVGPMSGQPITINVSTADATSTLDAISCNSSARSVTVGTTGGLLSATVTVPVSVTVTTLVHPLGTTISGAITATLPAGGTPGSVTITVPSQSYDTPYSSSGSQVQLAAPALDTPTVTSGGLTTSQATDVLNAVATSLVTPIVDAVNSSVLGPLSDLTGLRTAGADVLLLDHPGCTTPALRG